MTESPPTLERMNATGSSTTSCLRTEIQRLSMPWARAWKTEEQTMQKPARRKLKLMVLRAGIPISSMLSEALKIASSLSGKSWNTAKPINMMETA